MLRQTDRGQARALSAGKGTEFGGIREQDVFLVVRRSQHSYRGA